MNNISYLSDFNKDTLTTFQARWREELYPSNVKRAKQLTKSIAVLNKRANLTSDPDLKERILQYNEDNYIGDRRRDNVSRKYVDQANLQDRMKANELKRSYNTNNTTVPTARQQRIAELKIKFGRIKDPKAALTLGDEDIVFKTIDEHNHPVWKRPATDEIKQTYPYKKPYKVVKDPAIDFNELFKDTSNRSSIVKSAQPLPSTKKPFRLKNEKLAAGLILGGSLATLGAASYYAYNKNRKTRSDKNKKRGKYNT